MTQSARKEAPLRIPKHSSVHVSSTKPWPPRAPQQGSCESARGEMAVHPAVEAVCIFDRPVIPFMPWEPPLIERHFESLTELCRQARLSEGILIVAGEWTHESALHFLLAVSVARWRRGGLRVSVAGNPYVGTSAPPRPLHADIAILLEAPAYPDLGAWLVREPDSVAVLVGPQEDCARAFQRQADFVASGHDPDFHSRVESAIRLWDTVFCEVPEDCQLVFLLNALGCDVPWGPWFQHGPLRRWILPVSHYFDGTSQGSAWWPREARGSPWARLLLAEWSSLPGQWLLWRWLARHPARLNQLARLLEKAVAEASWLAPLAARAQYRLRLRSPFDCCSTPLR